MSNYSLSVSLRINHPSAASRTITAALGLPPSITRDVGEQRASPNGQLLDGINDETFWVHRFGLTGEGSLESCLQSLLMELETRRVFFEECDSAGARCELFVGVFLDGNAGFKLDATTASKLSALKLALSVCLYLPEPEKPLKGSGGGGP